MSARAAAGPFDAASIADLTARLRAGTNTLRSAPYTGCPGCADDLLQEAAEAIDILFAAASKGATP